MAVTKNFTIGPGSWTRIASGHGDGSIVKVDGGPFVLAVTVGKASVLPEIPVLAGHRFDATAEIPIVAAQHLWACASTSTQITVT